MGGSGLPNSRVFSPSATSVLRRGFAFPHPVGRPRGRPRMLPLVFFAVVSLLSSGQALAQSWDITYEGDVMPDQAAPAWELEYVDGSADPNLQEIVEIPGEPGNYALHIVGASLDKSKWQMKDAEAQPPHSMEMEARVRFIDASDRDNLVLAIQDKEYRVSISWHVWHLYLDRPNQPIFLSPRLVDTGWHVIRVELSRGMKGRFWVWVDGELIDAGIAEEHAVESTRFKFGEDKTDETGEMYVDYVRCRFEYAEYGSIAGMFTANGELISGKHDLTVYVPGHQHVAPGPPIEGGHYSIDRVLPGTYPVIAEWKTGGTVYVAFAEVLAGEVTTVDFDWKVLYRGSGPSEDHDDVWTRLAQSFVATDTEASHVTYRAAGVQYSDEVGLSFRLTDPGGPRIGPEYRMEPKGDHPGHCHWHAGDVMLMPGQTYLLALYQYEPPEPFGQTGTYFYDGDPYSDGTLLYHGVPQPTLDLDGRITGTQDGYLAPMNELPQDTEYEWADSFGQTFRSFGSSVVAVIFQPVWDTALHGVVDVSVHEGGPTGPQVGPTQTLFSKSRHGAYGAAVLWSPGQVPVEQGQTYYVQLQERFGTGMGITLTGHDYQEYAHGQAYVEGSPDPGGRDLHMIVVTEGQLPLMEISQLDVTDVGMDEATVSWQTDVAARCRVTYEREGGQEQGTQMETAAGTDHLFHLQGLAEDAVYTATAECVAQEHSYTTELVEFRTLTSSTSPPGWLGTGWNLMSFPLEPLVREASAALDDCVAAGNDITNALFRYTPGAGYEIYPGVFTETDLGRAYWLHLVVAATEDLVGAKSGGDIEIALSDGWNLFGHPHADAVLWSSCWVSDGVTTKTVPEAEAAGWLDPAAYYYEGGAYKQLRSDGTGNDDSLRPWSGYWVLANQAGLSLIIPAP